MLEKIKSRKFVLAVASALLVVLNQGLGLNLPDEAIMKVVGIVCSYIFGQSLVDAVAAKKNSIVISDNSSEK